MNENVTLILNKNILKKTRRINTSSLFFCSQFVIIKYCPEIDGLRAIAVGAEILYHAQITIFGHQPFKGGFIGVDIF